MQIRKKFKVGDYVQVKSNAPGTAWEAGIIEDINEDGALIGFGSKGLPAYLRLHGLYGRKPLDDLVLVQIHPSRAEGGKDNEWSRRTFYPS